MSKKIIINGITLEGANITPLLLKVRKWQSFGYEVTFFGIDELKIQIDNLGILENYRFIALNHGKKWATKPRFVYECFKRNFFAALRARQLSKEFDVVYTISPVLDLVLLPYLLKKINKKIKWLSVFDNSVPLMIDGKFVAGNRFIRVLAWVFYEISLFFIKSADSIFVIKPELKIYLQKKGFDPGKLILTGNGVERDLIDQAIVSDEYRIDALFIGRINEAKGIYGMLRVLEKVKEKYPDFQLAIMGRGDDRTEALFKTKIQRMHLKNNVQFLGYRSGQEKFNIIKSSKIFLFLSETESVPIAPLEAVCSGLKTLVYDLDAYNMYKNDEVIIFKKNDYDSVANKVIEIFDKKDFANEKGKLLLAAYDWEKIAAIELDCLAA